MRCFATAHDTHEGGPVPPQGPSLRQKSRSPQLFCKRLFGDDNYGIAIREHIEIHFWLCADKHVAENTSCYVRVNDIHALHADLAKRFDVGEIVETPWGMDELSVFDPSGSLVKFGQVTDRFIQADAVQEAPSD